MKRWIKITYGSNTAGWRTLINRVINWNSQTSLCSFHILLLTFVLFVLLQKTKEKSNIGTPQSCSVSLSPQWWTQLSGLWVIQSILSVYTIRKETVFCKDNTQLINGKCGAPILDVFPLKPVRDASLRTSEIMCSPFQADCRCFSSSVC